MSVKIELVKKHGTVTGVLVEAEHSQDGESPVGRVQWDKIIDLLPCGVFEFDS